MKIVIDVSQMAYTGTGVARYLRALVPALFRLGSPHQFVLYAGRLRQGAFFHKLAQEAPWNQVDWCFRPIPPKFAGLLFHTLNIPLETMTGACDLVHTSDWVEPNTRAPKVTTVHDLVFRKYPETVDPLIRFTQSARLHKIIHNHTHIIADSMSTKEDLIKIYQLNSARIDVIYPGIEAQFQPVLKQDIERVKIKYKLPDQFVLSVGTQEPRKNLARLQEAMNELKIPLVLVGRHGWGAHTQTLGYVPDEDLPALYSAARVFAYPSLYEGFGFPVLEAMACGTPVVTSNVSSLPEIAGGAAILVDPTDPLQIADGIKQALTDRQQLIKLGIAQAKRFSWANTAQQVLEVYEKVAHRH